MAKSFSGSFAQVLSSFNNDSPTQVARSLGRYQPCGEIKRYLELSRGSTFVDPVSVRAITTHGVAWSECR